MILLVLLPLFFLLPVVGLVLGILTAVDVGKYPEWAFGQVGASKTVWQILPIVLGFFCLGIGGMVMYFMWTSSKRDLVARTAQSGMPPPYGYGGPPQSIPPPAYPPPAYPPPGAPPAASQGYPPPWTPPQQHQPAPQYPPSRFPPPGEAPPAPPPQPPTESPQ